mgnify:CR=1 FL=1
MGVELQEVTCYNVYKAERTLLIACKEALEQIELTRYAEAFENEGITNILKYGIACYKKRCRVTMIKTQLHIVQVKQEAYQVEIP